MKCPRCAGTLKKTHYEDIEVDQCPSCHGIWLDRGELQPILTNEETVFSEALKAASVAGQTFGMPEAEKLSVEPCPKCSKPMAPMSFSANSGVIIDSCAEHGIWLDAQELEKIQAVHEHWEAKRMSPAFKANLSVMLGKESAEAEDAAKRREETIKNAMGPVGRLHIFLRKLLGALID